MKDDSPKSKYASLPGASAIDLQDLRYAVAAADHGSFRRAAEALMLRQSTLSRCIRQLEHSIGMAVFERSSGGVRATTAGRDFLRTARSILEQMDSLVKSTHHAGRGEAWRLSVGFHTSLSAGNLRTTLLRNLIRPATRARSASARAELGSRSSAATQPLSKSSAPPKPALWASQTAKAKAVWLART